jgi:uncharacterized membrane protein YdfJ with MMPL/SSD domain
MIRLAKLVVRAPRLGLAGGALLAVAAAIAGATATDRLGIAGLSDPGSQGARTLSRLSRALGYQPEPGVVVLATSRTSVRSAPTQVAIAGLARRISRDPAVGKVETAFGREGIPILVSRDGHKTALLVHLRNIPDTNLTAAIDRIRRDARAPGLHLAFGGFQVGVVDDNRITRSDLVRAELIAFPLLALLLILVFRGVVAALLPLAIGGFSVAVTAAALRLLSQAVDLSIFALNVAVLLGLGLGVDYGLFLVSRYREEAAARGPGNAAMYVTMATAGRAVLISGCTVAAASAALLLFPEQFIYSMGIAGVVVSLLSAGAALVIIPALFVVAGPRLTQGRRASAASGRDVRWSRFARYVVRRPVAIALASSLVIVGAGAVALGARWTFLDARALPRHLASREVADTLRTQFTPYLEFPISVAVRLDAERAGLSPSSLPAAIGRLPSAGLVGPLHRVSANTGFLQLLSRNPPLSAQSQGLVAALRGLPARVLVGGRIADFVDLKHSLRQRAPPAIALAALTTMILVFILTASLVLPVKAVIMNVLSLAAVLGLLVAVFQDNVLGIADLIAYDGPAAIETSVMVVVAALTFGLATDYSILLLSRIKEAHDAGESNEDAIADGMRCSGRVITNAALLLAVALLALASSRVFLAKQLTVGLAIGVLIDATIVRALLVPSLMCLLGRMNWWAPSPLRRLHARIARAPA